MPHFPAHLTEAALIADIAGEKPQYLYGVLRVNATNPDEAFVSVAGIQRDVVVKRNFQNRALAGDVVALRLGDEGAQRTATKKTVRAAEKAEPLYHILPPAIADAIHAHKDTYIASVYAMAQHLHALSVQPVGAVVSVLSRVARRAIGHFVPAEAAAEQHARGTDSPARRNSGGAKAKDSPARRNSGHGGHGGHGRRKSGGGGGGGGGWVLRPTDPRLPFCAVDDEDLPEEVVAGTHEGKLFVGTIRDWPETSLYPYVTDVQLVGNAAELSTGCAAILLSHDIADQPFSDAVNDSLLAFSAPVASDSDGGASGGAGASASSTEATVWQIPPAEVSRRRDMRSACIFTCDPLTARDLDDALSVRRIPDTEDEIEVGVHIADVSYFVRPGTAVDLEAAARCTSSYLVSRVIPMLPRILCEQLCSLNPGVDRLALSVLWRMKLDGTVLENPWYGETVIHSCAKLDYGSAQRINDGEVTAESWPADGPLAVVDAKHRADIVDALRLLDTAAKAMRDKRFAGGALALARNKVTFSLDADGEPQDLSVYKIHPSHHMIEEMMLMANHLVGKLLQDNLGPGAVLRAHPPMDTMQTQKLQDAVESLGLSADWTSSASVHRMLRAAEALDAAKATVIAHLSKKPMRPAFYFAGPGISHHFALNMDVYTHFTSPIRRYADVMVHRELKQVLAAQASGGSAVVDEHALSVQCERCNIAKKAAKDAQERCDRLYLAALAARKVIETDAVVCDIGGPRYFDILLPAWDLQIRVETAKAWPHAQADWDGEKEELTVDTPTPTVLGLFSTLRVRLQPNGSVPADLQAQVL